MVGIVNPISKPAAYPEVVTMVSSKKTMGKKAKTIVHGICHEDRDVKA
jgi:hypothetical protein